MNLSFPPRISHARRPTPVQKLERISRELGTEIWIKRDDLTGLELSGNKIRKLEFLAADALEKKATCLITCGGVQSNHCRATAALAARLGLRCVLLLRGEEPSRPGSNFLLDKIFGAEIFYLTDEQYYEGMGELKIMLDSQIRSQGGLSYFIPEGGTGGLGCFGYADAFLEVERQRQAGEIPGLQGKFDSMVFATGSGGTQAGLLLGKLAGGDSETRIVGVNVCYDKQETFRRVKDALWSAIQGHRLPLSFFAEEIEILDGFRGRGYALSRPEELEFLTMVARTEGVLLDPVYTGKAFFGLYNTLKGNRDHFGGKVLFFHTGGAFGLFRPDDQWSEVLE